MPAPREQELLKLAIEISFPQRDLHIRSSMALPLGGEQPRRNVA